MTYPKTKAAFLTLYGFPCLCKLCEARGVGTLVALPHQNINTVLFPKQPLNDKYPLLQLLEGHTLVKHNQFYKLATKQNTQ